MSPRGSTAEDLIALMVGSGGWRVARTSMQPACRRGTRDKIEERGEGREKEDGGGDRAR